MMRRHRRPERPGDAAADTQLARLLDFVARTYALTDLANGEKLDDLERAARHLLYTGDDAIQVPVRAESMFDAFMWDEELPAAETYRAVNLIPLEVMDASALCCGLSLKRTIHIVVHRGRLLAVSHSSTTTYQSVEYVRRMR